MYNAFYGLREKPFVLSPNPRFLFLADSHREAMAHLLYGLEQGEGFIVITGEVGTGKTTLCRTLLERLGGETEVAFLFNPSQNACELLQSINEEFGLPCRSESRRALLRELNEFLLARSRESRRVVLIIDEAQNLSRETLEQVRLVSNLETSASKLIQIILLGQPELDAKLDSDALRQLRQRVSVRWSLSPLPFSDMCGYIEHRLRVAAGARRQIFSRAAMREIHRRTAGVPRLVNVLCDRTLLAGYAAGEPRIGAGLVRQAARELPDAERRGAGIAWLRRPWVSVSAAGAVAAFVVGLLLSEQLVLTQASTPVLPHVASPAPVDEEQPDEKAVWVSMEIPISELEPETTSIAPEVVPPMLASATAKASPPSDVLDASAGVEMLTVDEDEHQGEFLARLLAEQQPEHAEELAVNAILERFGLPILVAAAARSEDRLAGLTRQHLSLAPLDDANMALLRRLDYPALIELLAEDGVLRLVALLGVDGEMVELMGAHGRESLHVPARAVDELMTGAATVVWRDYELTSPLLSMGDRGIAVRWLQQSMVDLGDDRLDVNGYYDLPTAEAVRRYQRKRRLRDDGIAGPLTQMLIYGDLDGYAPPRLSAGAGRRGGGAG